MTFQWFYGLEGQSACRFVREKVFVEEQHFSKELEFDEIDGHAWHLSVTEDGKPLAAARLFSEAGEWHCGRICILPEGRGTGLGLEVMEEIARKAQGLGARELTLSAQCRVQAFYEKAGYRAFGEEYLDEYCPHVAMKRGL